MRQRLAAILCLALLAASLSGCTKCGWLWDGSGQACHSGVPR
jgi:hypothetical protein